MAELIKSADTQDNNSNNTSGTRANSSSAPTNTPSPAPVGPTPTQQAFNARNNKQQGSGFTNINKVVQANQNNRLGQTIAGGIRQNVNNAQQNLNTARQNFQNQSQANQLGTQEQQNQRQSFLDRAAQGNVSNEDIANAQKFLSGQYTGPQGLQNSDTLLGQAQSAQQLAGQVGSTGGRQALLQRFAGGGGPYSSGQQRLDNLLLGQTGAPALQQVRRAGQGLVQQATGAEQSAENAAKQLGLQAQQFGQDTNRLIGQQETGLQGEVQNQLQAAQDKETARQNAYNDLRNQLGQVVNQQDPSQLAKALQSAKDQGLIDQNTFNDLNYKAQLLGGSDKSNLVQKQSEAARDVAMFNNFASAFKNPPVNNQFSPFSTPNTLLSDIYSSDPNHRVYNAIKNMNSIDASNYLSNLANRRQQDAALYSQLQNTSQADLAQQVLGNLTNTEAQNLTNQGVSDQSQRARANALSALRGQGTVFTGETPTFTAGQTAFNSQGVNDSQGNQILNQILGQQNINSNNLAPLSALEYLKRQAGIT